MEAASGPWSPSLSMVVVHVPHSRVLYVVLLIIPRYSFQWYLCSVVTVVHGRMGVGAVESTQYSQTKDLQNDNGVPNVRGTTRCSVGGLLGACGLNSEGTSGVTDGTPEICKGQRK